MKILVLTGLKRECRLISAVGVEVLAGGGVHSHLQAEAARMAASADGILSMGIAGGLAPACGPGQWVVANAVIDGGSTYPTTPEWSARIRSKLPGAMNGSVLGQNEIVSTSDEKERFYEQSGALAVDMESHIAARVAAQHRIPFAVARVVSDGPGRSLPAAARVAMARNGSIDVLAVVKSLLRAPWQIPALVRTAIEAEQSFRELARGSRALGPSLGFVGADISDLPLDVT